MIFLGDLACPPGRASVFNDAIETLDVFSDHVVVLNFEAVILSGREPVKDTLYNHESVLDGFQKKAKKVIVSLANNHMYDYPDEILRTKSLLEKRDVGVFGLLGTDGKIDPYEFEDETGAYAFFGHCWNLYTATNPNRMNEVRIVDCDYNTFVKAVTAYIESNPGRQVYCFMHWNYDLEIMPFPMHIRLSHDLIDVGVSGVIGSHSHVTHGVELYKGRPIAYCLGNFYLPSGIYFDGNLIYPEKSKHTLGLRIQGGKPDVLCFETDKDKPIELAGTASLQDYSIQPTCLKSYTKIFKKRRTKKLLVPIFDSYSGLIYQLNNQLAIWRVKLIKAMLKFQRK